MAFVYRSERKLDLAPSADVLGPGSYIAHKEYKQKPSYVPFSSKTGRENDDGGPGYRNTSPG